MMGMPLILRDKLIGVLGVANPRDRPAFTRSDIQMLQAIASQMDTAIFESLQTQRLRDAFGLCVGPRVMERLLTISDRDLLSGERRMVSTLFSDIRGFTNMAEQIAPEQLQAVLNDHLSALTELVLTYEGTLDKYIGDSVMCFFNAPESQPDHALRAVRLALEMQTRPARPHRPLARAPAAAAHRRGHQHRRDDDGQFWLAPAAGIHRHRARREPGRAAVRRGRGRPDPHQPGHLRAGGAVCRGRAPATDPAEGD